MFTQSPVDPCCESHWFMDLSHFSERKPINPLDCQYQHSIIQELLRRLKP